MAPMTPPGSVWDAWDTFSNPIGKSEKIHIKERLSSCFSPYLNRFEKRAPRVPTHPWQARFWHPAVSVISPLEGGSVHRSPRQTIVPPGCRSEADHRYMRHSK